jgi:hypothetical protein
MARLSHTHEQECKYCHQAFIPVKRGTQLFCSSSCRTTYCKKKKAGTLGRLTKLKGPGRSGPAASFAEMTLAAGAGALAANTLTQGAEYYAVTKGLVEQVTQLTVLVQQLHAKQAAQEARSKTDAMLLGRGILTLLTRAGASKEEAWAALHTPFSLPAPAELPRGEEEPLPAMAPLTTAPPLPREQPVPATAQLEAELAALLQTLAEGRPAGAE